MCRTENRGPVDPVSATPEPLLPAGVPPWVLVVLAGLVLALLGWLLARAAKLLAAVVAVGVIGVASWLAWEHVFG